MSKEWYYEEYDDQSDADFDYVGVLDKNPIKITNLPAQVAEFRRLYGNDITIYVYNSKVCGAVT